MNILVLNTLMERGGAQKAMLTLSKKLIERGHHVIVVTMYDKKDIIAEYEKIFNLTIINLDMKKFNNNKLFSSIDTLKGILSLYRLIRQNRIHILQTFSHYSNILGPIVGLIAGANVRITSQRMSLKGVSSWIRILDRFIANSFLTTKMVAVSDGTRDYCIKEQKISPDKIITISNGIDLAKWYDKPETSVLADLRSELELGDTNLVITTIARLHMQKNHLFYINAIKSLISDYPNLIFLFVGDGPLHDNIESKIQEFKLEKHIRLLGARSDIKEILSVSDIFVLPSLWEGMPNSVIEAMCIGLPVIVSDVDGCAEVVSSPDLGILFDPDNIDQLSSSIKTLIDSPDKRTILGNNARKHINKNFNQENVIDKFEKLYAEYNRVQ